MAGFWNKQGLRVVDNPHWVILGLGIGSLLVALMHLPLAFPIFVIAGLLAWNISTENQYYLFAATLVPPVVAMYSKVDFFVLNFFIILLIQYCNILFYRKSKSWAVTIEVMTLALIVGLLAVLTMVPEFSQFIVMELVKQQMLLLNPASADQAKLMLETTRPILLGLFAMISFLESVLYTILSGWWNSHLQSKTKKPEKNWMDIRVSITMLIVSGISVLVSFGLSSHIASQIALICFVPFFCAGVSTAFWLYQHSKNRKKIGSFGFIWLIFILLYATLLPLALAMLGLLDAGVDFRKRVLLKQKKI